MRVALSKIIFSVAMSVILLPGISYAKEVDANVSFLDSLPEKALKERAYYAQSNDYFIEKLDEPQVVIDGQTLHPKLQYEFQERRKQRKKRNIDYNQWLFDKMEEPGGSEWLLKTAEQNWVKTAKDVGPMAKVKDVMIDAPYEKIRVRIYWPENPKTQKSPQAGPYLFSWRRFHYVHQ